MTIQKDYDRSLRKIHEALARIDEKHTDQLVFARTVQAKLRPPSDVASRKYLMMLMLFSQTLTALGDALTVRAQLVLVSTQLARKPTTPDLLRKLRRIDSQALTQEKNIADATLLLEYRGSVLSDLLEGKETNSRYT